MTARVASCGDAELLPPALNWNRAGSGKADRRPAGERLEHAVKKWNPVFHKKACDNNKKRA
ncbi:MAG: hypothetical protein IOC52_14065 [Methylobacterium sp.]|nr:hypothetical protein [Methylobacterium sp.]MCA3625287.1 hypothetical protein [Methylobacterium sp.]